MTRSLAAVIVAALLALSACGGDDGGGEPASEAKPVGQEIGGSVVQVADCGDWKKGTVAERRATVVELRQQLTPQTSETAASPLSDERAYEILDKACSTRFDSLRLYKLYVRAQAFAPLSE